MCDRTTVKLGEETQGPEIGPGLGNATWGVLAQDARDPGFSPQHLNQALVAPT